MAPFVLYENTVYENPVWMNSVFAQQKTRSCGLGFIGRCDGDIGVDVQSLSL